MNIYTKIELALADPYDYVNTTGILLGSIDATAFYLQVLNENLIHLMVKDEEDFYSINPMFMGKKVYRSKEPLNEVLLTKEPR